MLRLWVKSSEKENQYAVLKERGGVKSPTILIWVETNFEILVTFSIIEDFK